MRTVACSTTGSALPNLSKTSKPVRSLAIYSLLATICGAGLLWASKTIDVRKVEVFYGIASTTETEINFSEPVEVEEIYVQAGDLVDSGQVLMRVARATKSARLADQPYRIRELEADQALDDQRLRSKLDVLGTEYRAKVDGLAADREQVAAELAYRRQLIGAVSSNVDPAGPEASYQPLANRLTEIDASLAALETRYEVEREAINRELALATRPASAAASRLRAEASFNRLQDSIHFEIVAPARGVIGGIEAKIGERKSAFALLVSFYEPSPRQVLSYVHEDRLLEAAVGDSVQITSLSNPQYSSFGVVTGMGSRIVEIPQRLRRMPDIQTYGREVVVAITPRNDFLQREKVSLTFLGRP